MSKYYIVDSAILPDVMDKVIEARQMLENGTVRQVSEAVKRVGISRGTYYKYKDYGNYKPTRYLMITSWKIVGGSGGNYPIYYKF